MASVEKDSRGYRLRFIGQDGKRKTIRLSGLNRANAEKVARYVEDIAIAKRNGLSMDPQTANWLKKIGTELHDKLSRAGLVECRQTSSVEDFTTEYLADAKTIDGKPAAANTLKKWKTAVKVLKQFFGNRNLRDISHDDAVKFRRWLDQTHLNENAKRTHISVVKMLFNAARRRKLVDENPFEFQKASLVVDRSRDFYLSRENAMKIIEACPDTQWRLIVALWRFAALRKMEIFHLRWEHVLWDQGRMLVTCQKTAHHEGKGSRFVPIGGILPWLEQAYHDATEGSQRVITRFSESNVNLAKPFEKIITAAGLTIWPKLIQNLRASCETEWLDEGHPAHVVARWVGHSVKIQNDNYAQVDDHHFEQFNRRAEQNSGMLKQVVSCPTSAEKNENSDLVGHRVGQKASATERTAEPRKRKNRENANVFRGSSHESGGRRKSPVPEAGVEPARGITLTGF